MTSVRYETILNKFSHEMDGKIKKYILKSRGMVTAVPLCVRILFRRAPLQYSRKERHLMGIGIPITNVTRPCYVAICDRRNL